MSRMIASGEGYSTNDGIDHYGPTSFRLASIEGEVSDRRGFDEHMGIVQLQKSVPDYASPDYVCGISSSRSHT